MMRFSVNDLRDLAGAFDALATSADEVARFCGEAVVVSLDRGALRIEGRVTDGPLALMAAPLGAAGAGIAADVADGPVAADPLGVRATNFGPPWSEAEREVILQVARAQPDFGSFAIAELVSQTLDRSQKAVDNYIRNNMRTSVQAARKAGLADRRAAEKLAFAPVRAVATKGAAKAAPRQDAYTAADDDRLVAWMIENPNASTYQCGRALCIEMKRSDRAIDMHMKKILAGRIARERAEIASAMAREKAVAVLSVVDEVSAAPANAAEVAAVGAGDAPAAVGPEAMADLVPVSVPFVGSAPVAVGPEVMADLVPVSVPFVGSALGAVPEVQKVLAPSPIEPLNSSEADDLQILTRLGRGEKIPMVAADMGFDTAYVSGRFMALLAPFKAKGYGPVDAQRKAIERLSARVRRA